MIYIVDHKFIIGRMQPPRVISVSQQSRLSTQYSNKSIPGCPLTVGETYKIYSIIYRTHSTESSVVYNFQNLKTKKITEVKFNSIGEADNFIARVSGNTEKLQQIQNQIVSASEGAN